MIITFYDNNFNALQNNASLNVGNSWSLHRKAVDFDEFTATSEAFIENINPTFVVLQTDIGRYKYGAFAGVPQLNSNNQTEVEASDLKTIHNNQVLLHFNSDDKSNLKYFSIDNGKGGTYIKLHEFLTYVFSEFYTQCVQDSFLVEYDLTDINDIPMTDFYPETGFNVYSLWDDLLKPYFKYYNVFMESRLDIGNKKIIFKVSRINKYSKALRLYEFDIKNYGKWIASVNECQVVVNNTSTNTLSKGNPLILNSQNEIGSVDLIDRDLYPIKKQLVYKETEKSDEVNNLLNEGLVECIEKLVEARYNESIELPVTKTVYENDFFDCSYNIYIEPSGHTKYKTLPIGEIQEEGSGNKTLIVGYKEDDIILYI